MFQSLSQSKVGIFANMLKKTVSGDDHKYSQLTQSQTVNKNVFFSDIFSVPGLTRLNQIVTGIIGVFLGTWITFLMGTILVQLLFYKLFAVLFGLFMILISTIFILNVALTPYDEASASRKLIAFIIFGICIFCGLLCVFLYGTDWTENARSIIVIRQDNYSTQTRSKLGKTGAQWKVLWTFLIGISIYFLIIYSCAEMVTTGIFQCKCFSFLWYRRPTCNYVYFMASALFCSVIISSAFTLFISIQKDSNVSIDSLIGDSNPSYISLSNMLYGMLMLKQLYLVIPFGIVFGPILALVFQFNYLKDWVDYQNIRNEGTQNGKGVLIKSTSLDLSDDDDDSPIDITRVSTNDMDQFFDTPQQSTHKQISFKSRQTQSPSNNSPNNNFNSSGTSHLTSFNTNSGNPLGAQVNVTVEQEHDNSFNPLVQDPASNLVISEEEEISFDAKDL